MIEIKSKSELQRIIEDNRGSLIFSKFGASWCGPCKMLEKTISELEKEHTDTVFVDINVDEAENDLLQDYSVMSVPKVVIFKKGDVVDNFVGNLSKSAIIQKLENLK